MPKKNFPSLWRIESSLGPLEHKVMHFIWNSGKVTVRDAVVNFQRQGKVAYTTIMTVMNNLHKKGFLKRAKVKKSYFYSPAVEENYALKSSLSKVLNDLLVSYGRGRILYSVFSANIIPKVNLKFFTPDSNKVVRTYRAPVGYGLSLTLLLSFFGFSAYDLLPNLKFFGTLDYLNFLASDATFSLDRLPLFVLAFLESLPIINILTTAISFILVALLAKKLSKLLNFRAPTSISLGGVI